LRRFTDNPGLASAEPRQHSVPGSRRARRRQDVVHLQRNARRSSRRSSPTQHLRPRRSATANRQPADPPTPASPRSARPGGADETPLRVRAPSPYHRQHHSHHCHPQPPQPSHHSRHRHPLRRCATQPRHQSRHRSSRHQPPTVPVREQHAPVQPPAPV